MTEQLNDPWWASYFDDVFLRIYRPLLGHERTAEEVASIIELLPVPDGGSILDVGCGWGRHAVELARHGFTVTGVDYSPAMIAEARLEAERAGVEVRFLCGDMRKLEFEGEFDAALSLFSSLGYFDAEEDDLTVLRGMQKAVKTSGSLLVETMHRDAIAASYIERDWWETPAGDHVWVERSFDPLAGISEEMLRWRARDGTTGAKPHRIRIRTASEWQDLLRKTGWQPQEWLGSWEGEPFTHESERLIVTATRG